MEYVIQTLMGALGSVGFAVVFNTKGKRLGFFFLGGALAWAVYLLCVHNGASMFVGLMFATITAGLSSEILARVIHAPVLISLVPMLVPLIPGSDLYYCMDALIRSDKETFLVRGTSAITAASAIGLGIICTTAFSHIVFSIIRHMHRTAK
ncbi:MAG: threonine/serine exporter family protein [Oscillospiraceae bacterium]|nr:threonine/serine exporter family protein [Oscillospiraceae bacterium]